MHALLVNQFFWPDAAATAQLLSDLGEDLAAQGCSVRAVAGRGHYAGNQAAVLPRRESWRGIEIRRVACTSFGRGSTLGRITDYLTFLVGAKAGILFGARQDVAVCLSTPPLLAVLGLVARLRGARFVYKVEDLYPDVAVALGTFRDGSAVARAFDRLSRALLRRADAVVALDGAMATRLRERGARRVEVIPNWADGSAIRPDTEAGAASRREHGLGGRFVVLYSGNLGLAHRFDAVIEAARRLAVVRPDVVFLFVGDGPRLAEVRRGVAGLGNVRFMPYQLREALNGLYNAADVHLVTLRDEVAGMLSPSKYPAALAAGKAVLLVGGEGADLWREIEEEQLGWCCPHDADAVVAALKEALQIRGLVEQRGASGRRVFEAKYERKACTARWAELLREVAAS
ncbi:MAG: glycosyltransferase family 4 protein [Planctomycetota bacterium]